MANGYCIKSGYQINTVLRTMDTVSNQTYWNKGRVNAAYYYQYDVYKYASDFISKAGLNTVVDVGCGPGVKLELIHQKNPHAHIIGIDQPHPIEYCKKTHLFGEWFSDDFENPSVLDSIPQADIVICSDVIEHVYDPDKLLSYIRALLRPEGYVILSTPERDLMRGPDCMTCVNDQHIREWNRQEFAQYVKMNDFEVMDHFCVRSYRLNWGKNFIRSEISRVLKMKPQKNNQLLLLKKM